ncbi:MAG: hypothetical protein ACN0LA_06640 [Candidatus Longimicrobiales bacterium M2_2A_002]
MTITGIEMKGGGTVPDGLAVQPLPNGFLRLTDSGTSGTDYSYYLVGKYGSNDGIRTEDPQIHNVDR